MVVVEPFNVPPALEKLGYGPTVIANQLVDHIKAILGDVNSKRTRREFVTPTTEPAADVEVPDTHVSLRSIVNYTRQYLIADRLRVSGDVTFDTNNVCLTIRPIGPNINPDLPGSSSLTGTVENMDLLFHRAAEQTLRYTDPYFLAAYYLVHHRTQEALRVIPLGLRGDSAPDKASSYFLWGIAYYEQTNYAAATTSMLKVLEIDPHYVQAIDWLGHLAIFQGRTSDAVNYYRKEIVEDARDAMAFMNLGAALLMQTNVQMAVTMTRRCIALDPTLPDAYRNLTLALCLATNYPAAIAACEQGLQRDPDFVSLHINLGSIYIAQSNYPSAIAAFKDAAEAEERRNRTGADPAKFYGSLDMSYYDGKLHFPAPPTMEAIYYNWGLALYLQGSYDDAYSLFQKAAYCNPHDSRPYSGIAHVLIARKQYNQVIETLREAIRIDPSDGNAYEDMAHALIKLGRYSEACTNLERAADLQPTDFNTLALWAEALRKLGDLKGALDKCARALQIDLKSAEMLIDMGGLLQQIGDLDAAIDKLHQAIAIDPNRPMAYFALGMCFQDKQDYHNAIAMYKRATDIDPKFTLAYVKWAAVLTTIGDDDGAEAKAEKALEISPHLTEHSREELQGFLERQEPIPTELAERS